MKMNKKIKVQHLGRVEGHGGIYVEIEGGHITKVNMDIYEGSRFYEELIVGKRYDEVAGIICRVCAICSADHLLASQMATEKAFGLETSQQTYLLRGLLLHGSMIESHSLHLYALALPDLLGYNGIISMATDYPKEVSIALSLKKLGNTIQELIGGRAVHPINPIIGGFGRVPSKKELLNLKDQLEQEQAVKKSEVLMNYDLKCYNKKLEIQIKEISRINESFLDQLVKLRLQLGSIFDQS